MIDCGKCIHYPVCDCDAYKSEHCAWFMEEPKHGECNQCRYYEGVHGVKGHAPCSFWGIGGVLWSDYCSRFEKEGDEK